MNFTVAQEETYNLIKLAKNAFAEGDKLKAEVKKLSKDNPFFVVNCKAIAAMEKDDRNVILALNSSAKSGGGSLIVSALKKELQPKLEEDGIHCLPTDNEAIDYIFMEQLEGQIGDDDDDDDDY